MSTYRVGEAGATVFDGEGKPLATLRPGYVVVDGKLTDPKSLASQHKRLCGYEDKRVTPPEDKAR